MNCCLTITLGQYQYYLFQNCVAPDRIHDVLSLPPHVDLS